MTMAQRPPATLVRRREVSRYEVGPRDLTGLPLALRAAAPVLMPATVLTSVLTDHPVLALTYDDGPARGHTPGVLDALGEAGVAGTFFVLSDQVQRSPELVRRMVDEGHEVGLHGKDHKRLSAVALRASVSELRDARAVVEDATGRRVGLYRPAYGAQTVGQLLAARALGMEVVMWSAWARDWQDDSQPELADRALTAAHPGAIMLLHDAPYGVRAGVDGVTRIPGFSRGGLTRDLVAGLHDRGFELLTVSNLAASGPQARSLWFERASDGRERASRGAAGPT
jgi:peptidoglycan/xylan/chitin deacetylase (PgdA/CDA1 family)